MNQDGIQHVWPSHSREMEVVYVPRFYKGRIQGHKRRMFPKEGVPLIKMLIETGEIENIDIDAPNAPEILATYAEKLNRELAKSRARSRTPNDNTEEALVNANVEQKLDKE